MNEALFLKINSLVGTYHWLDVLVILTAKSLPYMVVVLLFLLAIRKSELKKLFFIPLAVAVGARFIVVEIIRFYYDSPRPFVALMEAKTLFPHEASASFPSGHATFFFTLAAAVYLKNKKVGLILGATALLISLARVYAGVHWPLDIAGGAILGILVGLLFYYLSHHNRN